MKANKDYSSHLSTAGLCIHIVRTKLLCSVWDNDRGTRHS